MPITPLSHMRWFMTLVRKLLRVSPGLTLLVVAATLVAQMASLLAFFLPLKVLILLGSPAVPSYFPAVMSDLDRDLLIFLLSSSAGGFYLLHLICERLITVASTRGVDLLEQQAGKLQLFDDQQEIFLEAYRQFSRAASSMVFVGLAFLLLALLYPLIACWFFLYLLSGMLLGWFASRRPMLGLLLLGERFVQSVTVWGALGFLGGFAFLVVDFVFGETQGLLAALVALLLSRQMFRHAVIVVKSLLKLHEQRDQYEALFIYHRPLAVGSATPKGRQIWRHLLPAHRLQWLDSLDRSLSESLCESTVVQWHDSGTTDVFIVQLSSSMQRATQVLIFYEKGRASMARKEAELLEAMRSVPVFPAAHLVGVHQVDKGFLHGFELPSGSRLLGGRGSARAARQLRSQLLKSAPPLELVERYRRSHNMLPARLDDELLEHLQLACNSAEEQRLLNQLEVQLGSLRQRLQAMPLAIMQTTRQVGPVAQCPDGQCYLLRWEHWALEPIGAGWPLADSEVKRYVAVLEEARSSRSDLGSMAVWDVYLVALTYGFEKACRRQLYRQALELLPKILAALAGDDKLRAIQFENLP